MVSRTRGLLAGAAVAALLVGVLAPALFAAPPKSRTIALYNIHTKETLAVEYKKNGKFVPDALEQINWIFRDWRLDEKTTMDPELVDLLWEVHTELGSQEPIHIISGYRARATNDMLRRTVGGQASESRHILGKAADVHFPDVPLKRIRYSALVRERGGVGYYPTSALPFVHVDTDAVRHWPRLPRYELALLFPNGRSRHMPADGGPISHEDVEAAQARHKELAAQVGEFLQLHARPLRPTLVADAGRTASTANDRIAALIDRSAGPLLAPPQLLVEPRLIDRPSRLASGPSDGERRKLTQLAALASMTGNGALDVPLAGATSPTAALGRADAADIVGRLGSGTVWVPAPAYDEEHPEELSYRPFSILPYLTETASADDPVLARLVHPDVSKTLELLDQAGAMPPMRLRPGRQLAQLLWAQQFTGEAVAVSRLFDHSAPPADGLANRTIRTSTR